MKYVTDIATVIQNSAEELNRIICNHVNQYQNEGKEVDIQFSINERSAGAMVIAYIEKTGNKESGNIEEQ